MGADGYILNPFEPVVFEATCYECSQGMDLSAPSMGHTDCVTDDGRLKVNLYQGNYEPR